MSKSNPPAFRSGTIVTPINPKVTERKSTACKIGNGDAPDEGLVRPQRMTTGSAIVGFQRKVTRQSLATDLAKVSKDDPTVPVRVTLPRSPEDVARGIFRESNGKVNGKPATRLVRTVDMGDEPLHAPRPVEVVETQTQPVVAEQAVATDEKALAKAAKAERDAEILAYLRRKGYTGHLHADIRTLALDALEAERQIAEYATA